MKNNTMNIFWVKTFDLFRSWQHNLNEIRETRKNARRERFIAILQDRYGYSKLKAAQEMDKHYSEIIFK